MNGFGDHSYFLRFEFLKLSFREKVYHQWIAWYRNQSNEDQNLLANLKEVLTAFYHLPELTAAGISEETLNAKTSLLDQETMHLVQNTIKDYLVKVPVNSRHLARDFCLRDAQATKNACLKI